MIDIRAAIVGSVVLAGSAIMLGMVLASNLPREMREECEKDLARNLKCEMVYIKPEGK